MNENKRVLLAMSGGVDSSAAAVLLREQGYEVAGVVLKMSPAHGQTVEDAKTAASQLGIPLFVKNMTAEFDREVVSYFAAEYRKGRTPNPCVVCNPKLKFKALLDTANAEGYDWIATGHYAGLRRENGVTYLTKGENLERDQSYMLCRLGQDVLSRLMFPLSHLPKPQVREIAEKAGLSCAKKPDSQEICFIPDNDYVSFLERFGGPLPGPGDFVAPDGAVLGAHRGIYRYTIGQRKGLGITFGEPRFVTAIDAARNTVTLGRDADRYTADVRLRALNLIAVDALEAPVWVEAKVRYAAKADRALLTPTGGGTAQLRFDTPQRAVTPGQVAALYTGDYVLGSGIITR